MISGSTTFEYLIKKYIPREEISNQILKKIEKFEKEIEGRLAIDKLNISNFNIALEQAIKHIEYTDQIIAWVQQLKLKIKMSKHIVEKRLNLETIKITKEIEDCQEIALITSKTEKNLKKTFMLKEKIINLQQEFDDAKMDYELIDVFVNECINEREARYAYYQAIKQVKLDIQTLPQ